MKPASDKKPLTTNDSVEHDCGITAHQRVKLFGVIKTKQKEPVSFTLMSTTLPFIHRCASVPCSRIGRDEVTSEDPLPAIVELAGDGMARERATRLTDVHHETTDDQ